MVALPPRLIFVTALCVAGGVAPMPILPEFVLWMSSPLASQNSEPTGPIYNLIVDIGNVLYIFYLIALELEVTPDDVKDDIAHGVTDMGVIVGCDPADIHLDLIAPG